MRNIVFDIILPAIIAILIGLFILVVSCVVLNEWKWGKTPAVECEARLIGSSFLPSTKTSHVTPIYGNRQMHVALTQTGHYEKYITEWDCGDLGRHVCHEKEVYQYAKDVSILLIKKREEAIRIVGIKH